VPAKAGIGMLVDNIMITVIITANNLRFIIIPPIKMVVPSVTGNFGLSGNILSELENNVLVQVDVR
jgi:hypothetical protein